MKAAYADPPYLGVAAKHYGALHPNASDYDRLETHAALVQRLMRGYDAWAMSTSASSLQRILSVCPPTVRVAAWIKPFASFKKGVTRAWTWEPVIFSFHRARPRAAAQPTWRDHLSESITMQRGFPGAKPERFCFWVFDGLNLEPGDEFCDLFPGSGAVTEAWKRWLVVARPVEQFSLLPSASALPRSASRDRQHPSAAKPGRAYTGEPA